MDRNKRMTRLAAPFIAALLAIGLVGAACMQQDSGTKTAAKAKASVATGVDTGASQLRATLTSLLQEHVYLAGLAISTGVSAGLDSPAFEASAGTLDENSVGLSKAIASVYGDPAGDQFLELWRKHIGFFVDYTKAKASGDEGAANKARSDLDGYRQDFGAFLASANENLTKDAVAEELVPHVNTVFDTIDAVVAKDPSVFGKLRQAAQVMPGTANVLAGAIAKQKDIK